jgi:hypothetical protein
MQESEAKASLENPCEESPGVAGQVADA